jgi:hypothetical protein
MIKPATVKGKIACTFSGEEDSAAIFIRTITSASLMMAA